MENKSSISLGEFFFLFSTVHLFAYMAENIFESSIASISRVTLKKRMLGMDLSNTCRLHFLWISLCNKPRRGEHEKKLANGRPFESDLQAFQVTQKPDKTVNPTLVH